MAFLSAVLAGDADAVRALGSSADLEATHAVHGEELTALMIAAHAGDTGVIRALAGLGANLESRADGGSTAIMDAAHQGRDEAIRALAELGADVSATTAGGHTALMFAASRGHVLAIRALAAWGADVTWVGRHGETALAWAAGRGHVPAIRALADLGADVTLAGDAQEGGVDALTAAARGGHIDALRALAEIGGGAWTISQILAARAQAKATDHLACARWLQRSIGWSAFQRTCDGRSGGAPRLVALLRAGADPALASPFGETPLALCRLALPKEGALPEDAAMTAVVAQALLPWRIDRHHLFPRGFVPRLVMLLLVQQRLERQAEAFALEQPQPLAPLLQSQRRRLVALQLTRELWLAMAPFLPRFGAVAGP